MTHILGIETSCDETAVAIVDGRRSILAHHIHSQTDDHKAYGGVVPEVAARAHLAYLPHLVRRCFEDTGLTFDDLDGLAATAGPGLIGGVFVGVSMAKAMACARNLSFIAVNHLEAHALTPRLTEDPPPAFPYLLLLVSGGHTQILRVNGLGDYTLCGTTIDDAAGEAFDKSAKLLNLGYPGGPQLEKLAQNGDPEHYPLPRPMLGREGCDFSFSGLKTAVRRVVEAGLTEQDRADLAASFQQTVAEVIVDRCRNAMADFNGESFVVSGGVAANTVIRTHLQALCRDQGLRFVAPPLALCTDNAAMVAWAGLERFQAGLTNALDFSPRPRWPLHTFQANT